MTTETVSNYHQHLKDRISDIISEYMSDDNLTPQHFVDDINGELKGWVDYYEQGRAKATEMQSKFEGIAT